ncbi:MAG TPA: cation diffusion facilitator family transporter [Solirubrobacteraceae bacterium]
MSTAYEHLEGELHRHDDRSHAHPHGGPHEHAQDHDHDHAGHAHRGGDGHSHGLVDPSIKRSREGVRSVAIALAILAATSAAQALVFALSGSLALLADLIHNGGDALTAVPLGIAFTLRSDAAERWAGVAVVAAIFISACVAGYESVLRLIEPSTPGHLPILAVAGAVGFAGNRLAAEVRSRAGQRLDSPALIADGAHARADAYVSLAVIASAAAIAVGAPILDPVIGLAMTLVILRITRESWRTIHGYDHAH